MTYLKQETISLESSDDFGYYEMSEVIPEIDYRQRLHDLYNLFLPLLDNLRGDTTKDYIYWPNRLERIEEIQTIMNNLIKD